MTKLLLKIWCNILRFGRGIRALLFTNRLRWIFIFLSGAIWGITYYYLYSFLLFISDTFNYLNIENIKEILNKSIPIIGLMFLLWSIWKVGKPFFYRYFDMKLWGIFKEEQNPEILVKYKNKENYIIQIWENFGVPVEEWRKNENNIGTRLKSFIIKDIDYGRTIKNGIDMGKIVLVTFPANKAIQKPFYWHDKYLSKDSETIIALGKDVAGQLVTVDFSVIPHMLLGGGSRSGKSYLLMNILQQAYKLGFEINCVDFKQFSFNKEFRDRCNNLFGLGELNAILDNLIDEFEIRAKKLLDEDCDKITEYNKIVKQKNLSKMKYIILAIDEVAEISVNPKASREQREYVSNIMEKLSFIARKGAAAGLFLILSTQRGDSEILAGQIRSNLDTRICGRADSILSKITIDNTDAANKIPKDAQGKFLSNSGIIFQAFKINPKKIFNEQYYNSKKKQ